ncbi:division/cell wall cluster transcriptional repressor MraZ [Elizabethkingia argentiflava]|uniref:Transcriptional regulator MraZ n=1 Tax=Elizabethkingia argenteiflava TaxID=2681556 RepID=A0A845PWQ8_9FLAO|nr:division/cell wall cluster transcriptional repressor MraZ [Elizabethkingia argenteiflava]NAW52284.1 division/cell wall cluster transcriptional repressor MraZ [Elizabethkingia argenteiflava]
MSHFIGTYECKIDDKGRLKVPTSLVKQMKNFADQPFVIKRSVFQPCLEVYPMSGWDKLMQKINALNRFIKKNADFIRMFTAGVKTVEIDNVGRLQVSKDLVQFASLKKEVVITSAGELFEIWNKDMYEQVISAQHVDFGVLAEEVMGTINTEDVS